MSNTSQQIGRLGEARIAEILEGAELPNAIKETYQPYDLIWEGIRINVKATAQLARTSKKGFAFSFNPKEAQNEIVIVFVALLGDKEYFWAEKAHPFVKRYKRIDESITCDKLPQAIKNASKLKVEAITKEHLVYKTLKVNYDQWLLFKEYADQLAKASGMKITLPNAIRHAIKKAQEPGATNGQ